MKKDYLLEICENEDTERNCTTGKLRFSKLFLDLGKEEAIYKATKYLKDTPEFQGKCHSKLDISLTSTTGFRHEFYKMQWVSDGNLSDTAGHFGEWRYFKNMREDKEDEEKDQMKSYIFSIVAIIVFNLLSLYYFANQLFPSINNIENTVTNTFFFLTTLFYLSISLLLKDVLIKKAKLAIYIKRVIFFLEFPFILVLGGVLFTFSKEIEHISIILIISLLGTLAMLIKIHYDYQAALKDFYGKKLRKE